jgi:hypothetical protein
MHHSFNILVLNILLHVSAFQNSIIRVSDMNMLRWCPMSWEGWELYIVTDGVSTSDVTKHNTPIHNILSPAPQLSISQKALGALAEDGNVMPKHVGATIYN